MRVRWLVWCGVLVGCGGKAPAPAATVSAAPPPPPPRACITVADDAANTINHATGDDTHVAFCVGTNVGECFSMQLPSGRLMKLATPPEPQPASVDTTAHVETTNPDLKVCADSTCKALTSQIWPGTAPLHAATNGAFAAVMMGDAEAGRGYVDVWDVTKSKKLASFRYARGDFKCGEIAMLGETIYVGANTCNAPSGRGTLYSIKGKKIAPVGGKDYGTFGSSFTQVTGTTWAFLNENGNRIALQDVATGKVIKILELGELFGKDSGAIGNPGESAIVRLGTGKLGVIAGTPATGSVAVVWVESGEINVVRAPMCH